MINTSLDYETKEYLRFKFELMKSIKKFKNKGLPVSFLADNLKNVDDYFPLDVFYEIAEKALNATPILAEDIESFNDDIKNEIIDAYDCGYILRIPIPLNGIGVDEVLDIYEGSSLVICDCIEGKDALFFIWHDECSYKMDVSDLLDFIFHLKLREVKHNGSDP